MVGESEMEVSFSHCNGSVPILLLSEKESSKSRSVFVVSPFSTNVNKGPLKFYYVN